MSDDITVADPAVYRKSAALVSIVAIAAFPALILLLHILEPQFAPSWRMLSEYALGQYGWLMNLAFRSLGVGTMVLIAVIWPYSNTFAGRIGLFFLMVFAVAVFSASFFITDPITHTGATTHIGAIHNACGFTAIPIFPIAATLTGIGLARNKRWFAAKRWLPYLTVIVWASLAIFIWAVVSSGIGPQSWMGWANRLNMAIYCAWLLTIAQFAWRIS